MQLQCTFLLWNDGLWSTVHIKIRLYHRVLIIEKRDHNFHKLIKESGENYIIIFYKCVFSMQLIC